MRRILRLAGVHVPQGNGQPLILQKRFFYCLAAAAFLCVAGSGGMLLVSGTPSFCKSCHIMKPYYDSWKSSAHGQRGVECLKCHAASGIQGILKVKFQAMRQVASYVTGTYGTRFHAEIPDSACLRPGCHEKRLLEGQVDFHGVRFDHTPHLNETRRGKQLRCQTCHSQIVQGAHLTVTESVCFTCHFKGYRPDDPAASPTANCTLCHNTPSQPVKLATGAEFSHKDYTGRSQVQCMMCHANCLQGTGSVPGQVCLACHSKTEDLEKRGDTAFLHQTHVSDHHVECFYCHSEIRHGKDVVHGAEAETGSCAQCHSDQHDKIAMLYSGRGARDVKSHPSVMWAASVQCMACHETPSVGGKRSPQGLGEATGAACAACHGDAVDGMIASWKEDGARMVGETQKKVEEAAARLARLPDSPEKEAGAKLLAEAQQELKFVISADPVHNPDYASSILENAGSKAAKVAQAVTQK